MMTGKEEQIFEKVKDIPPMPQVASKVINILENPDFSFAELVRVISKDPSVTASILKMANSALFAPKNDITNLTQAISFLGVKNVKNLVITLSTKSLFTGSNTRFFDNKIWEHSVATAIISRIVVLNIDKKKAEEAFLVGLMHDLGQIIMLKSMPEYENLLADAFNENLSIYDLESERMGFTHSDVGAYLMKKWNLPPLYENSIAYHHKPANADNDFLAKIVCYANNFTKINNIGVTRNIDKCYYQKMLEIDEETLSECENFFFEIFENEKEIFNL
jgi:HD-like signal output (HDOD) protein